MCCAAIPRRMAARNAGGYTAAAAVRFAPDASLPCSTACSCNFGSPADRPSLLHRKHTRLRISGEELIQRVGLRAGRRPAPIDTGPAPAH
eukprot:9118630-Alexandrium_andersonii.AAC.1